MESPKPIIVFHPESKMVLESQNITLKCGVNSSSPEKINFLWKKDNHDLEPISSNHYSSFEVSGVTQFSILNFYNISMLQSGRYQCVASNEFGIAYSNDSILSIAGKYQKIKMYLRLVCNLKNRTYFFLSHFLAIFFGNHLSELPWPPFGKFLYRLS